jgi:cyclophilin family peptidyl-prolyl cis-trans isomerase
MFNLSNLAVMKKSCFAFLIVLCQFCAYTQLPNPSFVNFLYNKQYPLHRLDTLTQQEQFFYMQFAASHPNDTASAQLRSILDGHVNYLNMASITMSQRPQLPKEYIWPLTQQNDSLNFDFLLNIVSHEDFLIDYLGRCVRTPRQANQYAEMGALLVDPYELQLWCNGVFYLIRNGQFTPKIQETLIQQFELWNNKTKNPLHHYPSSYWKAISRIPKSKFDKTTWSSLLQELPLLPRNTPPNKYFLQVLGKCDQLEFNKILTAWSREMGLTKELRLECLLQLQRNNFIDQASLFEIIAEQNDVLGAQAIQLCANQIRYDSIPLPLEWENKSFKSHHPEMYWKFWEWRLKTTNFDIKGKKSWKTFIDEEDEYQRMRAFAGLSHRKKCLSQLVQYLLSSKATATDLYYGTEMLIASHASLQVSNFWNNDAVQLWNTNDIGVQALLASSIKEAKVEGDLKKKWQDLMAPRLTTLTLPKEVETYNEIVMALNAMAMETGEKFMTFQPQPQVKIEPQQWKELKANRAFDMVVNIHGEDHKMVFVVEEGNHPITAMHFKSLVQSGFYDNKHIHRYVPNFVSQGGCPRGDGMGSLDEVIPSEFTNDTFDFGSIGWASAGPHTESCQIFFMTSEAGHLDGRYTNMGQVIHGMEFLPEMTIGTTIKSIREVQP